MAGRGRELTERLHCGLDLLLGHAVAGVAHPQGRFAALARCGRDDHLAARAGELDRVGEKIEHDLLDLSKIEAGKLDLVFASVNLNELVRGCVALMQPQANQQRIIIRSSLSPNLPPVTADARSVRQIVLNLLSNSIKFTGAGGQVIVSTAATERGERPCGCVTLATA